VLAGSHEHKLMVQFESHTESREAVTGATVECVQSKGKKDQVNDHKIMKTMP